MIPRTDSRITGTGGGGQSGWGAGTPFFCKICGRTVGRKHVRNAGSNPVDPEPVERGISNGNR